MSIVLYLSLRRISTLTFALSFLFVCILAQNTCKQCLQGSKTVAFGEVALQKINGSI